MKMAVINPNWHFDGSICFACRAPGPSVLGFEVRR